MKNIILISFILLSVTSCVDSEKGKLDNRVLDFWHAKINKDFKTAYEFLSPGWKSNESEQNYSIRMVASKIKWLSAKIENKICKQSDLCQVSILIEYEYQFKGVMGKKIKVPTTIKENWIMRNNIWYNIPKETKIG